jgi:hypothetical protein
LARKPEGRKLLEGTRRRSEDNIKMKSKEVGCGLESSGSGWGPMAGCCEGNNEPLSSIKGEEIL